MFCSRVIEFAYHGKWLENKLLPYGRMVCPKAKNGSASRRCQRMNCRTNREAVAVVILCALRRSSIGPVRRTVILHPIGHTACSGLATKPVLASAITAAVTAATCSNDSRLLPCSFVPIGSVAFLQFFYIEFSTSSEEWVADVAVTPQLYIYLSVRSVAILRPIPASAARRSASPWAEMLWGSFSAPRRSLPVHQQRAASHWMLSNAGPRHWGGRPAAKTKLLPLLIPWGEAHEGASQCALVSASAKTAVTAQIQIPFR